MYIYVYIYIYYCSNQHWVPVPFLLDRGILKSQNYQCGIKWLRYFDASFAPPKKLWFWEPTTSCGQLRKKRVQQQQQPKFTQHITPIARLRVSCDASLVLTGEPAQSRRYHQTPTGHQPDTANTPLRHRRGTAVSRHQDMSDAP